jgi:hypothetical protein
MKKILSILTLAALCLSITAAPPVNYYGPEHRVFLADALVIIQAPGHANGFNAGHYMRGEMHAWLNAAARSVSAGTYGPTWTVDLGDGVSVTVEAAATFDAPTLTAWLKLATKNL